MNAVNELSEWKALARHWQENSQQQMRQLFQSEPERFERMSLHACGMLLDYSKNRISGEGMGLLFDLARRIDLQGWIGRMFEGEKINSTEHRAVLHTALRNRSGNPVLVDGEDVMPGFTGYWIRWGALSKRCAAVNGEDSVAGRSVMWST